MFKNYAIVLLALGCVVGYINMETMNKRFDRIVKVAHRHADAVNLQKGTIEE